MDTDNCSITTIQDYLRLSEKLHTAGQPTAAQLENLAAGNIQAVINIALPTSDDAVDTEAAIVTRQGLPYFQIPVDWERPRILDFELFRLIVQSLRDRVLLIHCARNMRVSAFIYLYRVIAEGLDHTEACADLLKIWLPTDQWYLFINQVRMQHGLAEIEFLPRQDD